MIYFWGSTLNKSVTLLQFEDVAALTGHLESLLHFRCQLSERESKAQEQVDQHRKALLELEEQHNLLLLQRNNQVSRLQTELEEIRSGGLIWVRHIILGQNPASRRLWNELWLSCLHTGEEMGSYSGNSCKENTETGTDKDGDTKPL